MVKLIRRAPAVPAGLSLATAIVVYLVSFSRVTMEQHFPWFAALHMGVFVLILPMFAVEYSAVKARVFFWKSFGAPMPRWAVPAIKILGGLAIAHFVLFLVLTRAASPEVKDGGYVLDNHGQTVRILSEEEYFRLKGWELRMFAAYWVFFYSVTGLYWWFPRSTVSVK